MQATTPQRTSVRSVNTKAFLSAFWKGSNIFVHISFMTNQSNIIKISLSIVLVRRLFDKLSLWIFIC